MAAKHAKHSRKRWLVAGVLVVLLVLITGGTAAAYHYQREGTSKLLPGVTIDGVSVGRMTPEDAAKAVSAQLQARMQLPILISAGKESWKTTPAELGAYAKVQDAVDQAVSAAQSYSSWSRMYHAATGTPVSESFTVQTGLHSSKVAAFLKSHVGTVLQPASDASVGIVNGNVHFTRSHPGTQLNATATVKQIDRAITNDATTVSIHTKTLKPKVSDKQLGYTIVIRISQNKLYLYKGMKVFKTWPVATAMPGFTTPLGTWQVVQKEKNPTWVNPAPKGWGAAEPAEIKPGPGNPLGTRALALDAPGILIHGTYDSASIGTYASHGCIRMQISDSEEIFNIVPTGTKVLIVN